MCKVGQDGAARHVRKGQGGIRWLQRKRRKNIRGFWIFVKVQFVLSLLVLGGLGYYVLGGYPQNGEQLHKEADSLVSEPRRRRFPGDILHNALCMRPDWQCDIQAQ